MDIYSIGKPGEKEAVNYLKANSYTILEVNYRVGHKEVDIIAEDKDNLIFIEVKTRSLNYIVDPRKAVTGKKQYNILRVANFYVKVNNINKNVRFDIIAIVRCGGNYKITHIENAFGLVV